MIYEYIIDENRKIKSLRSVGEVETDTAIKCYLFTAIVGDLADKYGNPLYELTENKEIIQVEPVITIEQQRSETFKYRQRNYILTDKLYMEAVYDNDDQKMQEWRDAVGKVKIDYPLRELKSERMV